MLPWGPLHVCQELYLHVVSLDWMPANSSVSNYAGEIFGRCLGTFSNNNLSLSLPFSLRAATHWAIQREEKWLPLVTLNFTPFDRRRFFRPRNCSVKHLIGFATSCVSLYVCAKLSLSLGVVQEVMDVPCQSRWK